MVDQLAGTLFPDGSGRLPACAEPQGAWPTLGPLRRQLHGLAALRAGARRLHDRAAAFAHAASTTMRPSSPPTSRPSRIICARAGYEPASSGKMHFVGPDQLHGFEERLTTDIYPADFGWTPDYRKPGERIDWWYHSSRRSPAPALPRPPTRWNMTTRWRSMRCAEALPAGARQRGRRPPAMVPDGVLHASARPLCGAAAILGPLRRLRGARAGGAGSIPSRTRTRTHSGFSMPATMQSFDITTADVRRARRGYFANISYIDDKVGELFAVLRATRMLDDTVIVFCSDHGDMLGERGLWFKMCFFEGLGAGAADDRRRAASSRGRSTSRSPIWTSCRRSATSPASTWRMCMPWTTGSPCCRSSPAAARRPAC